MNWKIFRNILGIILTGYGGVLIGMGIEDNSKYLSLFGLFLYVIGIFIFDF